MSHALTHFTRSTYTPSSPSSPILASRLAVTSSTQCEDPPPPQKRGSSPELPPPTGYKHNRIVHNQIVDDQENMSFTEIEDRGKSLSYNQSFLSSTQDSAESIATPPEADFDDEQLRILVASPLFIQEREASAERSQVYHSERENFMSKSSQDPTSGGTRKLVAVFSSQSGLNQDTFSEREQLVDVVFVSNEPIFRFSNPTNVSISLLDGNRDHLLTQARSELMKQEYKVESLNTCIDELQQQTNAQRLELEDSHHGHVESRRE